MAPSEKRKNVVLQDEYYLQYSLVALGGTWLVWRYYGFLLALLAFFTTVWVVPDMKWYLFLTFTAIVESIKEGKILF